MSKSDLSIDSSKAWQLNCNMELRVGFFTNTFIKTSLGNLPPLSEVGGGPRIAETATSSPDLHLLRKTTSLEFCESQSTKKSPKEPNWPACIHDGCTCNSIYSMGYIQAHTHYVVIQTDNYIKCTCLCMCQEKVQSSISQQLG